MSSAGADCVIMLVVTRSAPVVAYDATYTFDLEGPFGWRLSADEVARASAVSLHGGGFARVVTTKELLDAAGA